MISDEITSIAMRKLAFILRMGSKCINVSTLKRSRLEHNSTVWSPYYNVHSQSLSKLQNKFIRHINIIINIPIEFINFNNLRTKNRLIKLSDKRELTNVLFLFKIIHYLFDSPELLELICINLSATLTRSNDTFQCNNNCNINYFIYSPLSRINRLANNI